MNISVEGDPREFESSKFVGSGLIVPELRFPFHHLPAVWPWASYFTSLCLSFLFCKMRIIINNKNAYCIGLP